MIYINELKKYALKISHAVQDWAHPEMDEIVSMLVLHTASLELVKDEFVELAPIRSCTGPFRLYGTSLPKIEYRVFDKQEIEILETKELTHMEFVKVRVEVSKPCRIEFKSTIDSTSAPHLHGCEIETKDKYKEPFNKLVLNLHRYFPFYNKKRM